MIKLQSAVECGECSQDNYKDTFLVTKISCQDFWDTFISISIFLNKFEDSFAYLKILLEMIFF